jgi:DNA-binding transcriptional MerR regulator
MSRISSLNHASVGTSAALLGEDGRTASETTQSEITISQMSRVFGVSLRTLRFYEDRGLIKPRREGNARYYRGADRVRMEMILKGKKLGFTLTEIQDLIAAKGRRKRRTSKISSTRSKSSPRLAIWSGSGAKSTAPSNGCGRRKADWLRARPRNRRVTSTTGGARQTSYALIRAASTMRTASAKAASIPRCVVSSWTASSAGCNGAAARLESRESRRTMSARIAL